jgi:YD repeat-containing protein
MGPGSAAPYGRRPSRSDATGRPTSDFASRTEYDALKRPVRQYLPYDPSDFRYNNSNVYTETTYDAAGRVVKYTLAYNELNKVSSVTESLADAAKTTTSYTYDADDQPETITHPKQFVVHLRPQGEGQVGLRGRLALRHGPQGHLVVVASRYAECRAGARRSGWEHPRKEEQR